MKVKESEVRCRLFGEKANLEAFRILTQIYVGW